MELFAPPRRRGAASRARLPWQLRLRRRRAIDAAGSTPQLGLAAGLSARSTSSSLLGRQQSLCAKLEAEAVDGERRAHEVVVRNGELEGSAPSSISAYGPADPTPRDLQALTVLKSSLFCPTLRTQVSAPWRPISTTSRPRAYRMALQAHRHGQSVPRGVASAFVLTSRSLSFDRFYPSSRFRFRQSLVARRRSARAYRRPRARPRRSEGVQDMQLDGTVASRRIRRSSRSPVPVPVAHCAPRMQCRSTPPTLVPRPHRG